MKTAVTRCLNLVVAVVVLATASSIRADDAPQHDAVTPAPRDGGWLERHESFNARVKQGNVDLLLIGDSITEGWEGAGAKVWQRFYGGRNAVNLGIGGDRTQHVLWRLDHGNVEGISPKLAVLMIGTNNSGTNTPEQIADGITAIVKKLRAALPQTKVLILGIFPRGPDANDARRQVNIKTNEIVAGLADGDMVHYLDIGPKFLAADGTLSTEIMPDLLHLSPAGYQIWAESIEDQVTALTGAARHDALAPVARDGGWMQRHEGFNSRVKQGNVDLIFIGDSITQAWESDGAQVWEQHYTSSGWNAVNLGISGDRTQHVLWRLDHGNIEGIAPKLAVIMIGTNNVGANRPDQITDGIAAIVKKLRTSLPQTKVLVLGIFPRGPDANDGARQFVASTNQIVARLADGDMVHYLDIGPKFLSDDGTLSTDIMPDLLHLSPAGYQIWAESIEGSVKELMGE